MDLTHPSMPVLFLVLGIGLGGLLRRMIDQARIVSARGAEALVRGKLQLVSRQLFRLQIERDCLKEELERALTMADNHEDRAQSMEAHLEIIRTTLGLSHIDLAKMDRIDLQGTNPFAHDVKPPTGQRT